MRKEIQSQKDVKLYNVMFYILATFSQTDSRRHSGSLSGCVHVSCTSWEELQEKASLKGVCVREKGAGMYLHGPILSSTCHWPRWIQQRMHCTDELFHVPFGGLSWRPVNLYWSLKWTMATLLGQNLTHKAQNFNLHLPTSGNSEKGSFTGGCTFSVSVPLSQKALHGAFMQKRNI